MAYAPGISSSPCHGHLRHISSLPTNFSHYNIRLCASVSAHPTTTPRRGLTLILSSNQVPHGLEFRFLRWGLDAAGNSRPATFPGAAGTGGGGALPLVTTARSQSMTRGSISRTSHRGISDHSSHFSSIREGTGMCVIRVEWRGHPSKRLRVFWTVHDLKATLYTLQGEKPMLCGEFVHPVLATNFGFLRR